ncbi:hypothetical protein JW905_04575, partial [bacterium]|nr:hypothetical protein [candidate division CSSED10-310 bacterium]
MHGRTELVMACLLLVGMGLPGREAPACGAESPLPNWETPAERALRRSGEWERGSVVPDPPPFAPRAMAEFNPMEGMLIRWTGTEYSATYHGLINAA